MEQNLIATIKDEDFGLTSVKKEVIRERVGSRGIVLREDGKLAIFYEENKGDYKLPGGGVEGDESPAETFKREVYEEVGCEIEDLKEIATVKEERSQAGFTQLSHVFISKLKTDLHELHLTAKERVWGGDVRWFTPEEALANLKECINNLKNLTEENLYHLKFMVMRDIKILEYVISNKILK